MYWAHIYLVPTVVLVAKGGQTAESLGSDPISSRGVRRGLIRAVVALLASYRSIAQELIWDTRGVFVSEKHSLFPREES